MSEQRKFQRYPIELAGELLVRGEHVAVVAQDLSEGGVRLLLPGPVADGAKLQLTLFLTQDGIEDADEEPLEAKCVVRWSAEREDGLTLIGSQFEGVDAAGKAQLGRFLKALNQS